MPLKLGIDRRHAFFFFSKTVEQLYPNRSSGPTAGERLSRRLARVQHRAPWSPPTVDLDLAGDNPHAALGDKAQGERVKPVLDAENPR